MSGIVWYLLAQFGGVIGVVVALFLHEFAHAVPLLLAGGRVHIFLGSDAGRTVRLGPMTITVGMDGVLNLMRYGRYEPSGRPSKLTSAVATLAGPVATVAVVSALGAVLYRGVSGPLSYGLTVIFLSELYRAVQTVVPRTYSRGPYAGTDSDGKRLLRLVRS